jgi:peptidoglycan/LPS O-acetylase OafA/YrhL
LSEKPKMDFMTTITTQKPERQFYIDWLRIILIISVFLFHIGMIFNTWSWHIKNDRLFGGILNQIMTFLHFWRMPLLFMLAGAGTYFALGKRTPGQYLSERFKRLVVPLAAGIFILVPVQVYIEKINQYDSLPAYYLHMFEGIYPVGNFSWHHLWFIVYLFVISLFISPFLNFLRGKRFRMFITLIEKIVTKPLALNLFIVPLLLSQILLRPYFETGTNDLINDWASITYYIIFFLAGFILLSSVKIAGAIRKYRFWHLAETIAAYVVIFKVSDLVRSEDFADTLREVVSVILAWACALTALGFARQHLNKNNQFRKLANEAIYPFYLLHQPVIVVTGYLAVQLEIEVVWKVILVLLSSFTLTVSIYWFIIRPFNLFRIIFGMKRLEKTNTVTVTGNIQENENACDKIRLSA